MRFLFDADHWQIVRNFFLCHGIKGGGESGFERIRHFLAGSRNRINLPSRIRDRLFKNEIGHLLPSY